MKTIGRLYNTQGIAIITERYTPEVQNAARYRGRALQEVLSDLSMMLGTPVVARFSVKAGCSCPCSPGFLLMAQTDTPQVAALALGKFRHAHWGIPRRVSEGFDIWVDVNNDRVETFKGPRETLDNRDWFTTQAEYKRREAYRRAAEVAWT